MRKLIHYLTMTLYLIVHNLGHLGLTVGMLVFLTLLMGTVIQEDFQPDFSPDPVAIVIDNRDQGDYGQALEAFLSQPVLEVALDLVDADQADYQVIIGPDYSDKMRETQVSLVQAPGASYSQGKWLSQLIEAYQESAQEDLQILSHMEEGYHPADFVQFSHRLQKIESLSLDHPFERAQVNDVASMTGMQFSVVSIGLIFLALILATTQMEMSVKDKYAGLNKRLNILPLSSAESVIFNLLSESMTTVIYFSVYFLIISLLDSQAFVGNPLWYFLWVLLLSLFMISLVDLLIGILPSKYLQFFQYVMILLFVVFHMFPLSRFLPERLSFITDYNWLAQLLQDPLYDYILTASLTSYWQKAICLIGFTSLFTGLNILWTSKRKEETP